MTIAVNPQPVTVANGTEPFDLDVKRFYIPGTVLNSTCPQCGEKCAKDLGDQYLSYPAANKKIDVTFCHEVEKDGKWDTHEWDVRVIVRVTVEAA